jgi:hypothetical protein
MMGDQPVLETPKSGIAPGETLTGSVRMPAAARDARAFRVRLSCQKIDDGGEDTSFETIWETERAYRAEALAEPGVLPLDIPLSPRAPATKLTGDDKHCWWLEVYAPIDGGTFQAKLDLPVAGSAPAGTPDVPAVFEPLGDYVPDLASRVSAMERIEIEQHPDGAATYFFPAWRSRRQLFNLVFFSLLQGIFWPVAIYLASSDGFALSLFVLGLVVSAPFILFMLLQIALPVTSCEWLTVSKKGLESDWMPIPGIHFRRRWTPEQIRDIRISGSYGYGARGIYEVRVVTHADTPAVLDELGLTGVLALTYRWMLTHWKEPVARGLSDLSNVRWITQDLAVRLGLELPHRLDPSGPELQRRPSLPSP